MRAPKFELGERRGLSPVWLGLAVGPAPLVLLLVLILGSVGGN